MQTHAMIQIIACAPAQHCGIPGSHMWQGSFPPRVFSIAEKHWSKEFKSDASASHAHGPLRRHRWRAIGPRHRVGAAPSRRTRPNQMRKGGGFYGAQLGKGQGGGRAGRFFPPAGADGHPLRSDVPRQDLRLDGRQLEAGRNFFIYFYHGWGSVTEASPKPLLITSQPGFRSDHQGRRDTGSQGGGSEQGR